MKSREIENGKNAVPTTGLYLPNSTKAECLAQRFVRFLLHIEIIISNGTYKYVARCNFVAFQKNRELIEFVLLSIQMAIWPFRDAID